LAATAHEAPGDGDDVGEEFVPDLGPRPELPGRPVLASASDSQPVPTAAQPRIDRIVSDQAYPNLILPVRSSGENVTSLQIPVLPADEYFSQWPQSTDTGLSGAQLQWLKKQGYRVERVRRFVPVQLEGGGGVLLPVESIGVHDDVR
jgi:hypothetical protein